MDFPLHYPALQFFFVLNVLIEMPAHTNSFIVLCNGLKSDFMTCACTSPSDSELRNFRTSDSASQLVRIARSGPTRTYRHWHSALSAATSPPPSGLLHSWPQLGPAIQKLSKHSSAVASLSQALTSVPGASPRATLALKRSVLMYWSAMTWQGQLIQRLTYVTNLQVKQYTYSATITILASTLVV